MLLPFSVKLGTFVFRGVEEFARGLRHCFGMVAFLVKFWSVWSVLFDYIVSVNEP